MLEGRRLPFDVSRETLDRLESYSTSLRRWTQTINLIASSTVNDIWGRHVLDCAQILPLAPPETAVWCDLGSGAGLPGIVLAILERESHPFRRVVLVESDRRKASFLMLQIKALDLNAQVVQNRIESAPAASADVVTARALAPLTKLLGYSLRHGNQRATSIFLKGRGFQDEIDQATRQFSFDLTQHQSLSDPAGAVLIIRNLQEKETVR